MVVNCNAEVRIAPAGPVSSARFRGPGGTTFVLSLDRHVLDRAILDRASSLMSGLETRARSHARSPMRPSWITGHDASELRSQARDLDSRAYLAKPVDHEALVAAIEEAVRGRPARGAK